MKVTGKYIILFAITACLIASCTKPYNPKVITSAGNYLVVEGIINTGGDSTKILLSRTVPLNSTTTSTPELGAVITIQSNQNQTYSLVEIGNGAYASTALTLPANAQYRLSIVTTDGKTYLSDYVAPVTTPPIDSVGFTPLSSKQVGTGLQIYVNTHDPNNNTHYYRWDYNQTWTFSAEYESYYITNGTAIVTRTPAQQVYQCWASSLSTNIELGSSAKLTQDVIYQAPLVFIPSTSEEIELRYSILVKQYALSADAYNYFSLLKQNTEQLGSIFDAQPSQLTGNIHCTTDATLPIIGYISAGTIQQKRIYINKSQLPHNWVATYPFDCITDTALFKYYPSPNALPINQVAQYLIPGTYPFTVTVPILPPGAMVPTGYQYVDQDCADCSIRGSTTPPSFWQNSN
jgi:hypothetical protein